MPPSRSLSSLERSNPPPRRKSCAACIKAKRRCTLESPACQRCTQRKLDCKYPDGRAPKRRLLSVPSTPGTLPEAADMLLPDWGLSPWDTATLGPLPDPVHPAVAIPSPPTCSLDDVSPVLGIHDVPLGGPTRLSSEMPPAGMETGPATPDETALCYPGLNLPLEEAISWAVKQRLQYAIDRIYEAPRQMVLENQTPWSHPCLYESSMPRAMQC